VTAFDWPFNGSRLSSFRLNNFVQQPGRAMRSIFTVHAGEFIVGEHLERTYEGLNAWVPAKDTGVDLLVTNSTNSKGVSFQVKFSRDFLTTDIGPEFQAPMRICGWFTLSPTKIENSSAQFWVFVLIGSKTRSRDYVIIEPTELFNRLKAIHLNDYERGRFQVYLWVTEKGRCWETRGLARDDQLRIAAGKFESSARDLTKYLNNWKMIEKLQSKEKAPAGETGA
jgi:hypothetical protein